MGCSAEEMRKKELSISSIHRVLKEDEQRTLFLLISFPKKKINEYRRWGGVKEQGRGKERYLKSVLLFS